MKYNTLQGGSKLSQENLQKEGKQGLEPCSDTFTFLDLVKNVSIQSISPLLEIVTLYLSASASAL